MVYAYFGDCLSQKNKRAFWGSLCHHLPAHQQCRPLLDEVSATEPDVPDDEVAAQQGEEDQLQHSMDLCNKKILT